MQIKVFSKLNTLDLNLVLPKNRPHHTKFQLPTMPRSGLKVFVRWLVSITIDKPYSTQRVNLPLKCGRMVHFDLVNLHTKSKLPTMTRSGWKVPGRWWWWWSRASLGFNLGSSWTMNIYNNKNYNNNINNNNNCMETRTTDKHTPGLFLVANSSPISDKNFY